jgi:integrase
VAKKKGSRGQNEGNIRQRKDGTWEARYTFNGKQKSVYGKTRPEVSAKLTKALNEINTGTFTEPSKLTVSSWLDIWLKDYVKQSVKIKTYTSYEDTVRIHIKPVIGNKNLKDLSSVDALHLITGITEKGLSPRMAKYVKTILSMALKQAVKSNILVKNVCEAVTLPKQKKKEIRVLTLQEQSDFIEAIKGHRLEAAFILDLFTGLRVGELVALKWSDIDLKEGILKVRENVQRIRVEGASSKTQLIYGEPKTEKGKRSIPLLEEVVQILKEHKKRQLEEEVKAGPLYEGKDKEERLIFCTELGKQLEIRNLQRTFYLLIEKAGLKNVNFHALRHTFATRGLENGITPKEMQELLGHSSITVTLDLYTQYYLNKKG